MNTQITIQELKVALLKYVDYVVTCNRTGNSTYEQMSDKVWKNEIMPFVVNEEISGWQVDIQKKFISNPYVRYEMSEKQAYCLAKAYQLINPTTIVD